MITGLYILTAQKEDSSGVLKESGSGVVEQRGLSPWEPSQAHQQKLVRCVPSIHVDSWLTLDDELDCVELVINRISLSLGVPDKPT